MAIDITAGQDCIVKPPCTCSGVTVNCSHVGLTETPEFHVTDQVFSALFIQLDGNFIITVHNRAFSNLTRTNCSDIRINLSDNELVTIEDGAFAEVDNSVTELQLHQNNLTFLPSALKTLSRLNSLSIFTNNIKTFEPIIMQKLGLSLKSFRVGISEGEPWPIGFKFLFGLEKLTLQDVQLPLLPFDAFLGFEETLTSLQIEYSSLFMVPTALCSLNKLLALSFSSNDNILDKQHLFPSCCPGLTSLRTLIVSNNGLSRFPTLFNTFPNLTTLRITNNPGLTYIDQSAITNTSKLTRLDLANNGLTQIPEALQTAKNLQRLDLSNNSITSIEDHNLGNFSSLVWLNLDGNPLSYISDHAFRLTSRLQDLSLDGVKLQTFPRAVLEMPALSTITLK